MSDQQALVFDIQYQEVAIQVLLAAIGLYLLKDIVCMLYLLARDCCPCLPRRISPTEEMIINLMFYYEYIHDKTANALTFKNKEISEHIRRMLNPSADANVSPDKTSAPVESLGSLHKLSAPTDNSGPPNIPPASKSAYDSSDKIPASGVKSDSQNQTSVSGDTSDSGNQTPAPTDNSGSPNNLSASKSATVYPDQPTAAGEKSVSSDETEEYHTPPEDPAGEKSVSSDETEAAGEKSVSSDETEEYHTPPEDPPVESSGSFNKLSGELRPGNTIQNSSIIS